MKEHNFITRPAGLGSLETAQLESLLHAELRQTDVDGEKVRQILKELESREGDAPPEISPAVARLWNAYRSEDRTAGANKPRARLWLFRAAAVAAVLALVLLAVPQQVEAGSFFQRMMRWTDSVFELFDPNPGPIGDREYVFRTDHPGLQEVYDAVTELGVTVPVVPMWIPEEYTLVQFKSFNDASKQVVVGEFQAPTGNIVLEIDTYDQNVSSVFQKNGQPVEIVELAGVEHIILRNKEAWIAVWTVDNLECSILVDCQESVLHDILRSIYIMEEI